ncbi:MAG: GNAT family N-acetyltransferase [Bacilli bacterium]|nr:GNAT family N-acetyltransferase [Bacilli bacterium]MBP3635572.1 GNAT family N-acetyltransferase [Bacilli bacterium]
MGNLEFKIISYNSEEYYDIKMKLHNWDNKHTYFHTECEDDFELETLLSKHKYSVALYECNNIVGYGEIANYYSSISAKSNILTPNLKISCIINPRYRKKGYGKILLEYLIIFCKRKYDNCILEAEILKKNKACLKLINDNEFKLVQSKKKSLVFKKKL